MWDFVLLLLCLGKRTSLCYRLFSSEKNAIGGFEVVEQCSDVQDCQRSIFLEDSEGIGLRKFLLQNSLSFCTCSFFAAFQNVPAELLPSSARARSEHQGSILGPSYS